jgi:hypothetical protein
MPEETRKTRRPNDLFQRCKSLKKRGETIEEALIRLKNFF